MKIYGCPVVLFNSKSSMLGEYIGDKIRRVSVPETEAVCLTVVVGNFSLKE